jgi:hypothetical protein
LKKLLTLVFLNKEIDLAVALEELFHDTTTNLVTVWQLIVNIFQKILCATFNQADTPKVSRVVQVTLEVGL